MERNNSNVQFDKDGAPIYEYYWNDKLVTQEKYENNLKKKYNKSDAKSPYENMMIIWKAQDKLLLMK